MAADRQMQSSVHGINKTGSTSRRLTLLILALQHIRAPLLMAAAITLLEVLSSTAFAVPYAARGLVYVLLVAVAAATDGLRAALVSSLIAVAFAAYLPGRPPDSRDLFALVFSSVLVAIVVGGLHERLDKLAQALESERQQLHENGRTRTEFMNAAAHELRTPITVITGYLSMLHEGSFGPAPQRWAAVLDIVTRKAQDLGALIEQMLLSGRLEAGTVATTLVPLDLRHAVQQAAERANPRATLLGAVVNYQLPSNAVMVEADPEHVARILDNLIDNALSYSGRQAWVRITAMEEGDAQVLLEDHGRGIPEEMRERIFERFVRAEDPDRTPVPGTGLGLAVSRGLAERQGGSLTLVRSEVGSGSLFVLRLPLAQAGRGSRSRPVAPNVVLQRADKRRIEVPRER
ncbi:MAG TPA: HAMP domain-containing sensor histidine kinase [Solirubrobacterales bacterium]|jgi:signal transduction histidine kinase